MWPEANVNTSTWAKACGGREVTVAVAWGTRWCPWPRCVNQSPKSFCKSRLRLQKFWNLKRLWNLVVLFFQVSNLQTNLKSWLITLYKTFLRLSCQSHIISYHYHLAHHVISQGCGCKQNGYCVVAICCRKFYD